MSKYILKNKDKIVLEFEVETIQEQSMGAINFQFYRQTIKSVKINDDNLLPFGLVKDNLKDRLQSWIKQRKFPKHRQFAKNILASIPMDFSDNFMSYIDISLGLSLNDSFWIVPADKDYKWKDFNLYENEFSEALALCAFGLKMTKVNGFTSSPEYTTNGMLRKCWHRDDGQIYLYKSKSEMYDGFGEAYSEFYMAQIADVLEFDYVPYDLKEFHGQIVSSCPIFTNENEGYMPMHILLKDFKNYGKIDLMQRISTLYGEHSFANLMLFDALICNIDRHLGNFGMIIDNNTNEILRPAPIFDNGLSFMATLNKNQLKEDISNFLLNDIGYFELEFNKQIELFVGTRHIPNLEKLTQFSFKRHHKFNINEKWLCLMEECIQSRAKLALNFAYKKEALNIQTTPPQSQLLLRP